MARRVADEEEARTLVNETRSKPVTGPAPSNPTTRFVVFVLAVLVLLGLVIAITPRPDGERASSIPFESEVHVVPGIGTTLAPTTTTKTGAQHTDSPSKNKKATMAPTKKSKAQATPSPTKKAKAPETPSPTKKAQEMFSPAGKHPADTPEDNDNTKETDLEDIEKEKEGEDDDKIVYNLTDEERQEEDDIVTLLDEEWRLYGEPPDDKGTVEPEEQEPEDQERAPPTDEEISRLKSLLDQGHSEEEFGEGAELVPKKLRALLLRTSQEPYNNLIRGKKYLLYNPSGGVSHQITQLLNAAGMAWHLNRTLLVPMLGKRTRLPRQYNNLLPEEYFPMDRFLDFELLQGFIHAVPLNVSVVRMLNIAHDTSGADSTRYVTPSSIYTGLEEAQLWINEPATLLFLDGSGMDKGWWPVWERENIRAHIAYNPVLRRIAVGVAKGPNLLEDYYAIQGFIGGETAQSMEQLLQTSRYTAWDSSRRVFLVIDDTSSAILAEAKSKFKVVMTKGLKGKEYNQFLEALPKREWLRSELLTVIEKLVCALALDFIGTPYTLFSLEVHMIRTHAKTVFPGLLSLRPGAERFERTMHEEEEEQVEDNSDQR